MNLKKPIRVFFALLIGFFVVMTLLTAWVVIPEINANFEQTRAQDKQTTLELEAELFERTVLQYRGLLEDLSKFPIITNSVLLSAGEDPNFVDLVGNFSIDGQKANLVFQDIAGDVIYKSPGNFEGDFSPDASWLASLLDAGADFHFQLLDIRDENLHFVVSVPVRYLGNVEGILSAEVRAPIQRFFSSQILSEGGAFKLQQGEALFSTDQTGIVLAREISRSIDPLDLKFTYISDDQQTLAVQNRIRNTILIVLFVGLGISFLLFTLLGYRTLVAEEEMRVASGAKNWGAYALPVAVGLIGIASSVAASSLLFNIQTQVARQALVATNNAKSANIQTEVENNLQSLTALAAFFNASEFVSRQEFKSFAAPLIGRTTAIQALEWIPAVPKDRRAGVEQEAQNDGLARFEFTERNASGALVKAGQRALYFPVFYVEPVRGNEQALGFDLGGDATRLVALEKAAATGKFVATARITLVQEAREQAGILLINPVYEKGHFAFDGHSLAAAQNEHLKGFVLSVLRVDDLVANALGSRFDINRLVVEDVTQGSEAEMLFDQTDGAQNMEGAISSEFNIAGRVWRITSLSPAGDRWSWANILPWAVLAVGILFSVFVTYSFLQLVRRRQVIEAVVETRTREIEDAKNFQDTIMSNIPDLLFVKDQEYRIVDANPAFLNVYPAQMRDQIIGTTTAEAYDEEEAQAFFHQDKLAFDHGLSEVEETIQFPDGGSRTLLTKKVRFENEQGDPFVLGIGRDITSLKEAERQLKILGASVENSNDMVMITEAENLDDGLKIIYVNEAFEKITGYKSDEVIGKTPRILQGPETSKNTLRDIRDHLEKGQPFRGELLNCSKSGQSYWVELNIFPIRNDGGEIIYFAAIERDVTVQKAAQRDREELRAAMENTVEGISQIDREGRYSFVNEAYASACGYTPDELLGRDWAITVHEDDHQDMNAAYQSMLETGKVVREPRGVRKDGTVFHKRVTMIAKYDAEGDFVGHHCFMSDVSARKLAEEEIMRSNLELERFAYVASHDLQEPLRMVTNFTGLLERKYGDALDDTAKQYIDFAHSGARRMQELVSDLLEYARVGKEAEKYEETDLNHTILLIRENLKESIEASKAVIATTDLPSVKTNPIRIMRLLQNLIGNAIKYQAPSNVPAIEIDAHQTDGVLTISVKDNGIGMKPEYCEKIFEPFKRLHGKSEYQGTGMGLAICRKIVEGLGGTIWAESAPGKGSKFYFTLPVIKEALSGNEENAA